MEPRIEIIVAADVENGIGINNNLPWRIPADLKRFKEITIGNGLNAVVMGRKTWESIPEKMRPLQSRLNIVMSHNRDYSVPEGVYLADSFEHAIELAKECETIFAIGGSSVYSEALQHPRCQCVHLTRVHSVFKCDTFLDYLDDFEVVKLGEIQEYKDLKYNFVELSRI